MQLRTLLFILLPVLVIAWWLFAEGAEQQVRQAHAELFGLVSKSPDDANAPSVLDAIALQNLFAESSAISGDAGPFVDSYSPEEIAGRVISLKSQFNSIVLTVGELAVEFTQADSATIGFRATLEGQIAGSRDETIVERRDVVSRMRRIDGDWRFTAFEFSAY